MSGMTLLEMTVVILVLLSMVSILFIGSIAWKRGSDRALCIMNQQRVQKGMRSYANAYGHNPGDTVSGLRHRVIGLGRFVETTPVCPGGGIYNIGGVSGEDVVPQMGVLYMPCSFSGAQNHVPQSYADW